MTNSVEPIVSKLAARCTPSPARGGWAAHAFGAALLVLLVAGGEVKLIEQAAAAPWNCGVNAPDGLVRIVDIGLASGFAPIAILR
jgi:hypothetical protein